MTADPTDAQSSASISRRPVPLHEKIKDPREHVPGNADTLIDDAHDRQMAFRVADDADCRAGIAELDRIADQVAEDLRQTVGIRIQLGARG